MHIKYDILSNFKIYESDTSPKVLLNICDPYHCDVTDSNVFYNRFYNKIRENFNNNNHRYILGDVDYVKIFSYHIICNMFCVEWPKTILNMEPFKYDYFKKCCLSLADYIKENSIEYLLSPIFGTEILEGDWNRILKIMNNIFPDKIHYVIIRTSR